MANRRSCASPRARSARRIALLLLLLPAADAAWARDPADTARPRLTVQRGHAEDIRSLAFSREGTHVLTSAFDRTVRLWEADTGREVRAIQVTGGVAHAVLSPDDKHVVAGSLDGKVRILEVVSGASIRTLAGHAKPITAVAVSPGGSLVAAAAHDASIRVWKRTGGQPVAVMAPGGAGHAGRVQAIAFRRDGAGLLTGGRGGRAIVWASESGQAAHVLPAPSPAVPVTAVAYEPSGAHVLVGYADGMLRRWSLARPPKLVTERKVHADGVLALAFDPQGRRVLTGSSDDTSLLLDVTTLAAIGAPKQHDHDVRAVAYARAGDLALTAAGRVARVWRMPSGAEFRRLEAPIDRVLEIAVSSDGRYLASGNARGHVHLWELPTGRLVRTLAGHERDVAALAFTADGTQLITGAEDTTVRVWNTRTGAAIRTLPPHRDGAHSVGVSGDGKRFITGGCDNEVRVWESGPDGALVATLRGHTGNVETVALSRDGRRALTGGLDTTVRLWSLGADGTATEAWRFTGFGAAVMGLAFCPTDERLAVAASQDSHARLIDLEARRAVQDFEGRNVEVQAVAFAPDGAHVLTGTADGEARLWKVGAGAGLDPVHVFRGHVEPVTSVAFSADGEHVFTGSYDRTIRIYQTRSGTHTATLVGFRDGTWAVRDPEGRFDASGAGDVEGLHWVVPSDAMPGAESVALDQLKRRFYEPGLLARRLGLNDQPLRPVAAFAKPALAPRVDASSENGVLRVRVADRGSGVGRVVVEVNGKPLPAEAVPAPAPAAQGSELAIDLGASGRLVPGEPNEIRVLAYDGENVLRSRGARVRQAAKGRKPDPTLWAVVAGISDYRGDLLDLNFAAKDAEAFHAALDMAAKGLFVTTKPRVTLLTDCGRKELLAALDAAKASRPGDVFVLYLAGHGVARKDSFHFLTAEAEDEELADPGVRAATSLSSEELTSALNAIPANKQALILDTCASGQFVEALTRRRGASSSQQRALELLKDQTGMYVLAGCAADRVSYEHPRFGQGLLTYSLLLALKGERLDEGRYVDVASFFGFAQRRVPEFAEQVGGAQVPVLAAPEGGASFRIGMLTPEARSRLPLRKPKPYVTQSHLTDVSAGDDVLGLCEKLDDALREASRPEKEAPFVFFDVKPLDDAYRIAGTYTQKGETIAARLALRRGRNETIGDPFDIECPVGEVVTRILHAALERLPEEAR